MIKKPTRFLTLLLLFIVSLVHAQESAITGSLDTPLPTDPEVIMGKLSNGLTYYIRQNEKPEDKVELRLVVNVGSMMEDEDQLGLAHFVEHMAFNGSKNFEKNELVSYLQSVGVKFGADLNAYTSFDETVYILPVPSDDEEILDKGLLVLEDWAHNISFTDEEIDKERGVVIEEWRLGRGANQRMRDEWFPVMFQDSRYAERLPIGKKEVLESFDYETIRKFYKDWYRPDLMSVIAVGDIDPIVMEKKIKEQFGKIKAVKNPRERKFYEVPDQDNTAISIVTDPEASFTQIQLIYKQDNKDTKTLNQFRRDISYNLYSGMITKRLDELKQSPEPPFFFASTSYGSMVRTKSNYSSFAVVGENGVEKGLSTLVMENQRVKKFGFTKGELERYKADMLNNMEQAYNEAEKTESERYASEYVRNFLSDEPIPGITFEYDFYKKILPTITVEEVNSLAKEWISNSNRVVVITGPEKEGVIMPTEEEVEKILFKAGLAKISPYDDGVVGAALLDDEPVPGKVTSSKELATVGATEIILSNGLKVVLKSTDFKNDEILLRAFSPGGQSIYPDEDNENASFSSQIINESGVSEFSVTALQKMMSGKTVQVNPFIGGLTEGINASAAPKDLETMFQLIYLYFTNPRKDSKSFESFKSKNKMLLGNLMSNPQFYYSDQVSRILTQNHPRGGGFPTPEDLDAINFERSFDIYQDRFADASDFTFVMVGNFDIAKITPLLETYLGSLPSTSRGESWKDMGVRPPSGKVEKTVTKGTDQKSLVTIVYTDETDFSKESNYDLRTLGELLSIKLIELLREEKGGVYGVGASGSLSQYPYESYNFRISFPCSPDNVDDLVKATFEEIEKIKNEGVSDEDINKLKETQKRERKENLMKNEYWLNSLYSYLFNGYDLSDYYKYEKQIEALNSTDLQEAAKKYLDQEEYIKIVLKPEMGN